MRLLQRVRPMRGQTKKPPQKLVAHLLGLLLMRPGHATCRHLGRDSTYHAKTLTRWYARDFDVVALNKAAIIHVIPAEHAQALVIAARFVPQSGKKTDGLDRCWNGRHSRPEKGLEISALAGRDITDQCASWLSVEQPPPADTATGAEATRIAVYRDQVTRVVSAHHLRHLRDVITEGDDSTQTCLGGIRALGLEPIGTRRLDAHRRDLYQGPQRSGPGRPKTSDGKVYGDNLSRSEKVQTADNAVVLSQQVLHQAQFQGNLCVVLVVDPTHNRQAVRFSTALHLDALTIYRSYKARFQSELLCRDANQFAGLTACQARSHAKLTFHFKASLSTVTCATLEARQQHGDAASGVSLASLQRRAFNQHLLERISQYGAQGHRLENPAPTPQSFVTTAPSPRRLPEFCPQYCSCNTSCYQRNSNTHDL